MKHTSAFCKKMAGNLQSSLSVKKYANSHYL